MIARSAIFSMILGVVGAIVWDDRGMYCYGIPHANLRTRAEAKADCGAEGAHLPYIKGQAIQTEFENAKAALNPSTYVYIGLTDVADEAGANKTSRNWVWDDGSTTLEYYHNWYPNEPDGGADCVVLDPGSNQWYDDGCTASYEVICQKECFECDVPHEWKIMGGHCYSYLDVGEKNFDDARILCEVLGGRLPKLNNPSIDQELIDARNSLGKDITQIWIGINSIAAGLCYDLNFCFTSGTYVWIDGEATAATWHNFKGGEPGIAPDYKDQCVRMMGTEKDQWAGSGCDSLFNVWCQKDQCPDSSHMQCQTTTTFSTLPETTHISTKDTTMQKTSRIATSPIFAPSPTTSIEYSTKNKSDCVRYYVNIGSAHIQIGDWCIVFETTTENFNDASMNCRIKGGRLLWAWNLEIVTMIKDNLPIAKMEMYIGFVQDITDGSYEEPGGAWFWQDSDDTLHHMNLCHTPWRNAQPNDASNNQNVAILDKTFRIQDKMAGTSYAYICEYNYPEYNLIPCPTINENELKLTTEQWFEESSAAHATSSQFSMIPTNMQIRQRNSHPSKTTKGVFSSAFISVDTWSNILHETSTNSVKISSQTPLMKMADKKSMTSMPKPSTKRISEVMDSNSNSISELENLHSSNSTAVSKTIYGSFTSASSVKEHVPTYESTVWSLNPGSTSSNVVSLFHSASPLSASVEEKITLSITDIPFSSLLREKTSVVKDHPTGKSSSTWFYETPNSDEISTVAVKTTDMKSESNSENVGINSHSYSTNQAGMSTFSKTVVEPKTSEKEYSSDIVSTTFEYSKTSPSSRKVQQNSTVSSQPQSQTSWHISTIEKSQSRIVVTSSTSISGSSFIAKFTSLFYRPSLSTKIYQMTASESRTAVVEKSTKPMRSLSHTRTSTSITHLRLSSRVSTPANTHTKMHKTTEFITDSMKTFAQTSSERISTSSAHLPVTKATKSGEYFTKDSISFSSTEGIPTNSSHPQQVLSFSTPKSTSSYQIIKSNTESLDSSSMHFTITNTLEKSLPQSVEIISKKSSTVARHHERFTELVSDNPFVGVYFETTNQKATSSSTTRSTENKKQQPTTFADGPDQKFVSSLAQNDAAPISTKYSGLKTLGTASKIPSLTSLKTTTQFRNLQSTDKTSLKNTEASSGISSRGIHTTTIDRVKTISTLNNTSDVYTTTFETGSSPNERNTESNDISLRLEDTQSFSTSEHHEKITERSSKLTQFFTSGAVLSSRSIRIFRSPQYNITSTLSNGNKLETSNSLVNTQNPTSTVMKPSILEVSNTFRQTEDFVSRKRSTVQQNILTKYENEKASPTSTDKSETNVPLSNDVIATSKPTVGVTEYPPLPLTKTEKIVVDIMQTLGCAYMIWILSIIIIVFALLREMSPERFIHLNQEISLLLAHILILTLRHETQWKMLCKLASLGLQYFFTVVFAFMALEAMQTYATMSNVINKGGYLSKKLYFAFGWGIPLTICVPSFVFSHHNYVSTYSIHEIVRCWLNAGDWVAASTLAPVFILAGLTIILAEASSMDFVSSLMIDRNQFKAAIGNQVGLFFVLPANIASWGVGLWAVFSVDVTLYSLVFALNITLGTSIFVFHAMGNPKAHEYLSKLWKKVFG